MADIALVVADSGNVATTTTKTMLEDLGHTVDVYLEGDVTVSNLSGYDIILTCRTSVPASSTLAGHLRDYNDNSIPLLVGFGVGPGGAVNTDYNDTMAVLLGMCGYERWQGSSASSYVLHPYHATFASTQTHGTLTLHSASDPYTGLKGVHGGLPADAWILLIQASGSIGDVLKMVHYPSGTKDINDRSWGTNVIFCTHLYRNYHANGATLIGNCISYLLGSRSHADGPQCPLYRYLGVDRSSRLVSIGGGDGIIVQNVVGQNMAGWLRAGRRPKP